MFVCGPAQWLNLQHCSGFTNLCIKATVAGLHVHEGMNELHQFLGNSRFVDLRSLAVILLIILIMTKFGPKLFASIAINAVIKHGYCKDKNHLTNMSFKAYWRQNIYRLLSKHSWQNIFDKLSAMMITSNVKMIKMIFLTSMSFQ